MAAASDQTNDAGRQVTGAGGEVLGAEFPRCHWCGVEIECGKSGTWRDAKTFRIDCADAKGRNGHAPTTWVERRRTQDKTLVEHAERTLAAALETLRMITPEGWERAHLVASLGENVERWNTNDAVLLRDVRLLTMRGGPRFRPEHAASKGD